MHRVIKDSKALLSEDSESDRSDGAIKEPSREQRNTSTLSTGAKVLLRRALPKLEALSKSDEYHSVVSSSMRDDGA